VIDRNASVKEVHQAFSSATSGKLPENISIQINKSGEEPAKIKVTRDGKSWEVTEKELGKLPEDIRPHIKRMLSGQAGAIGFGVDGTKMRLKAIQVHPDATAKPVPAAAARAIRVLRQATESDGSVEQLWKDVEALKAAVKRLEARQPKPKKEKKED